MATYDILSGLQLNTIDGAENNLPSYINLKHYEVSKFYTFNEHNRVPELVSINKASLEKLTKEDQEILKKAAKEASKIEIAEWKKKNDQAMEKAKAAGSKFIEIKDKTPFIKAVQPVYEEYAKDYLPLIKKIQDIK